MWAVLLADVVCFLFFFGILGQFSSSASTERLPCQSDWWPHHSPKPCAWRCNYVCIYKCAVSGIHVLPYTGGISLCYLKKHWNKRYSLSTIGQFRMLLERKCNVFSSIYFCKIEYLSIACFLIFFEKTLWNACSVMSITPIVTTSFL